MAWATTGLFSSAILSAPFHAAVDGVLDAFGPERELGETGGRFGLADELVELFFIFYLELALQHVVVHSDPRVAIPDGANGVQVPVDALFPHVICFDAVRPYRDPEVLVVELLLRRSRM